jgi:RNA polymerase sigma-70 factor, ECF subfamily
MQTTPVSLLQQLRRPSPDGAWPRFVQLYAPLLFQWARRLHLQDSDTADLVQDVLVILVQKLPTFEYDQGKSFRAWLKTVFMNRYRQYCRARPLNTGAAVEEIADSADVDAAEEEEYRRYLIHRALPLLEPEFSPTLWAAFQQYVLAGRPPAEVARDLGIAVGTVYSIKLKVLYRMRQELQGLLD